LETFGWTLKKKDDLDKLKKKLNHHKENIKKSHNKIKDLIAYIDEVKSLQKKGMHLADVDTKYNEFKKEINNINSEIGRVRIIEDLEKFFSYKSVQDPFDIK
ncbi:hypothetical protein, partial [Pectobacterium cacticida]